MSELRVRENRPLYRATSIQFWTRVTLWKWSMPGHIQLHSCRIKHAEFWAQVFPNAKPRTDLALAQYVEFGWAIQKGTPQLKAALDDFLKTRTVGTSFGNTLMRRYLLDSQVC